MSVKAKNILFGTQIYSHTKKKPKLKLSNNIDATCSSNTDAVTLAAATTMLSTSSTNSQLMNFKCGFNTKASTANEEYFSFFQ